MANFYLLGLWLILGDRPPHHHNLCVAHRGNHGQALFTLLCVPRGPALQPTLATLGRRHPSGSPIGAGGRGHAGHLGRYRQEKSQYAYRGSRPLPQWRWLSPPRISHAAGLKLRFGRDAYSSQIKRWPGYSLSVPFGLELHLKPAQAQQRNVPYRSRSQLTRDSLDFMAQQVSGRPIRSLADGGYATKDYVRRTSVAAPRAKKAT